MMKINALWASALGLSAAMAAVIASMVVTLEPSRAALQTRQQEHASAPGNAEGATRAAGGQENSLDFEGMLGSAKETYFSSCYKEDADKKQAKKYARELAAKAQRLARTEEQQFRALFLMSALADEAERRERLPANGEKLLALAQDDAQKGRAHYILAEGFRANQNNEDAIDAYEKSAEYLLDPATRSKTDRVFGVWQLCNAAEVVQVRLKDPGLAETMYAGALERLDEEQAPPNLDGPIREAILLRMTGLYLRGGEPTPGYEELNKKQQDVMLQMKRLHPDRTGAYIAEQWERIKLHKI